MQKKGVERMVWTMRISDETLKQLEILTTTFPDSGPHKWSQVYRGPGRDGNILISDIAPDDPGWTYCADLHFPLVSNISLNIMAMAYKYLPAMIQEIQEQRSSADAWRLKCAMGEAEERRDEAKMKGESEKWHHADWWKGLPRP